MKNILIVGGCGGIGKETALTLYKNGYNVIVIDKKYLPLQNITVIESDITNIQSLSNARQQVLNKIDFIDAIINLAGIFGMDSVLEGDTQKLKNAFEVNFWGCSNVVKVFFDLLKPNGKIIIMTSELSRYSVAPFNGFYSLPKIALDNYCDCLRRECNYLGIQVIKIQGGSFKTQMLTTAEVEFNRLTENSTHFNEILPIYKPFVLKELKKGHSVEIFTKVVLKILKRQKCKSCYRIKNSSKLMLIDALPCSWQDKLYLLFIKLFKKQ